MAGDGKISPTTPATPTKNSSESGANLRTFRKLALRAAGSNGSVPDRWGKRPARATHTHATISTTGSSVMMATTTSVRSCERSNAATLPNTRVTKRRLHAAKTLNLVLLDEKATHAKKAKATELSAPRTRAWC
jgi:hypothetical protein